jgi:hypothetical protein
MNNSKISSGPSGFNPFQSKKYLQASNEFLASNSIIAKLAFFLLVLFVFIILLKFGTYLLSLLFNFSRDPVLIPGLVQGDKLLTIIQDPRTTGSIPILRSKNQYDGLEFTWSVWIFVNQPKAPTSASESYNQVFSKGSYPPSAGALAPSNAPGLYISSNFTTDAETGITTSLVAVMDTFKYNDGITGTPVQEKIVIQDLPIRKWINVILRCDQHKFDIFINGMLTRSRVFDGVPQQNYGDVYIGAQTGFSGEVSKLQYFARALGTTKINSIVNTGPDLNVIEEEVDHGKESIPHYLSLRWFFPSPSPA